MPLQSLQLATVRSSPCLGRRVARATNKINPSVVIAFVREINLQEMQHHARLLRSERNQWQQFAGRELYGGKSGKKLDMGKGCVRFKKLEDLALDVVGRTVARVSAEEHMAITERRGHTWARETPNSEILREQGGFASEAAAQRRAPCSEARAAPYFSVKICTLTPISLLCAASSRDPLRRLCRIDIGIQRSDLISRVASR